MARWIRDYRYYRSGTQIYAPRNSIVIVRIWYTRSTAIILYHVLVERKKQLQWFAHDPLAV